MTDDELDALLEGLEAALEEDVRAALTLTAQDFADALDGATALVAARFSVSGIRDMWRRRVSPLMTRLRRIATRGAEVAAQDAGGELPDEWERGLDGYWKPTRELLDAVGHRLAVAASQALADGLNRGEDIDALKARLLSVFVADGAQLGDSRATRIAMTEATRAFNAGVLAAAQVLTGPDRPLVKQWVTRRDDRVREAHADTNGQLQLLDEPFDVGGVPMQYPGDPTAPAELTVNCRCVLRTATAPERTAAMTEDLTAGADVHTGAMIALMPTEEDAARLALDGGEAADQLHLTLFYLGDAVDWTAEQQGHLISRVSYAARVLTPIGGRAFGAAQWNPASDEPAWVWNVGNDNDVPGSRLEDAKYETVYALEDGHDDPELPQQYTPWSPHICAVYSKDAWGDRLAAQTGPVTFDRIRVAFAGQYTDLPLTGGYVDELADGPMPEPMPVEQGYVPGDRVRVAGDPHEPGQTTGTVEEVNNGPVYGIVFDGMEDLGVHRWYAEEELLPEEVPVAEPSDIAPLPTVVGWHTPGDAALAFEGEQTGDSRVFAPGALYWTGGPWPLQYADQMNGGHDGARLAGAIFDMSRDGPRIPGAGVLYLTQPAGVEVAMLLAEGAPLGVSVDLDDVSLELVDRTGGEAYTASLITASVMQLPDGGWHLTGETAPEWTASGTGTVGESSRIDIVMGADCSVPAAAFELAAAAGESGSGGVVVETQRSGDYLARIIRARVRGATLVTIPAYDRARIVLDDPPAYALAASDSLTAGAAGNHYDRVVRHVRKSLVPVTAADAARFLRLPIALVRRHLARAARKEEIVRISRGTYVGPTTKTASADVGDLEELAASVTGAVDLPVADRGREWDGDAAAARVFAWADGDTGRIGKAFAYRDDDADPDTKAAYKLGYADVLDGTLTIVPRGVFAAQAAMEGARGGVNIPADEVDAVTARLAAVRAHVDEETGGDQMDDMQASAWTAMRDLPPMPSAWFAEPTEDELPPGGAGVNYANGRVFGWVAQAGEPHAGFAKKITIDGLGRIDTSHFLRQRFTLDDGSSVKAGAFTMNVGHHRDGAECETSACQFDDSRTVAGIVTVGMNARGMWFSGAAAPWMSEWDRRVFLSTQPSYHMRKGANGAWQLRAVLSVPVPGHSSPLMASAVVDRSNMALTAAATMAEVEQSVIAVTEAVVAAAEAVGPHAVAAVAPEAEGIDYDRLADSLVAAMARADQRKAAEDAELEALIAEASRLDDDTDGTAEGN